MRRLGWDDLVLVVNLGGAGAGRGGGDVEDAVLVNSEGRHNVRLEGGLGLDVVGLVGRDGASVLDGVEAVVDGHAAALRLSLDEVFQFKRLSITTTFLYSIMAEGFL